MFARLGWALRCERQWDVRAGSMARVGLGVGWCPHGGILREAKVGSSPVWPFFRSAPKFIFGEQRRDLPAAHHGGRRYRYRRHPVLWCDTHRMSAPLPCMAPTSIGAAPASSLFYTVAFAQQKNDLGFTGDDLAHPVHRAPPCPTRSPDACTTSAVHRGPRPICALATPPHPPGILLCLAQFCNLGFPSCASR